MLAFSCANLAVTFKKANFNKMNKGNLTGWLLIFAALTFWISWYLMPDPGTVDTVHILNIVKENRTAVLASVIIQITSSVLYVLALFYLIRQIYPGKTTM